MENENSSKKKVGIEIGICIVVIIIVFSILIMTRTLFYQSNSIENNTTNTTLNNSSTNKEITPEIELKLRDKTAIKVDLLKKFILDEYMPEFNYFMATNKTDHYQIEYMIHDKTNSTYSFLDFGYDKETLELITIKYVVTDIVASHKINTDMSIFLGISAIFDTALSANSSFENDYNEIVENISYKNTMYINNKANYKKEYKYSKSKITVELNSNLIIEFSKI